MMQAAGRYLVLGLLTLLAIIVLPNIEQLQEKLGFDTRASLKQSQQHLEDSLQQVAETNQRNLETQQRIEADKKIADTATAEVVVKNTEVDKQLVVVLEKRDRTLRKIKTPPPNAISTTEKTETPPTANLVQVDMDAVNQASEANISALWEIYDANKGDV
jgi:hypothetical protein